MANGATITDGSHTVTLTVMQKPEFSFPTNIAEVPIPGREGGQVQYLGSPQHTITLTGILNQLSGGTDDFASFQKSGSLDLIRKNTAADTTLTITHNATQIYMGTCRITGYDWWTIKGSTMAWGAYSIKFKEKG